MPLKWGIDSRLNEWRCRWSDVSYLDELRAKESVEAVQLVHDSYRHHEHLLKVRWSMLGGTCILSFLLLIGLL